MLKSHKDLLVWQKGIELVKITYATTRAMPKDELYGLSSQMRRAAVSIPSNISEGHQRKSLKEFIQFLRIAFGSAAELETQFILASDLYGNIDFTVAKSILLEIQRMLNVLIRKLETRP